MSRFLPRVSGLRAIALMMFAGFSFISIMPVEARSLFDVLFGNFGASPPEQKPAAATMPSPPDGADTTKVNSAPPAYRTVCVRLCDGYYFPLSHGVSASSLANDKAACSAQCQGDVRLFYMAPGAEIDSAVDLAGRPYKGLPNAFRYRRSMDQACTCRPPPWSASERKRHENYARIEQGLPVDPPERSPGPSASAAADRPKPAMRKVATRSVAPAATRPSANLDPPKAIIARGLFGGSGGDLNVTPARGLFGKL